MSETLRKRSREPEPLLDSIDVEDQKRFHCEETDRFLHLLRLEKSLSDDEEEECAPSEELVNGIIRSLEEEIGSTCSTSYHPSNHGDIAAAADISSGHESQTQDSDSAVDLCHVLEVSDDELSILPSPVLDLKDKIWQSPKETSDSLSESTDLKYLGETWHFEDDFDSFAHYQQFAVYEDVWDASQLQDCINIDFVSQGMLFDVDFSAPRRPETANGM